MLGECKSYIVTHLSLVVSINVNITFLPKIIIWFTEFDSRSGVSAPKEKKQEGNNWAIKKIISWLDTTVRVPVGERVDLVATTT